VGENGWDATGGGEGKNKIRDDGSYLEVVTEGRRGRREERIKKKTWRDRRVFIGKESPPKSEKARNHKRFRTGKFATT